MTETSRQIPESVIQQARRILDAARDGRDIEDDRISWALRILGDLE